MRLLIDDQRTFEADVIARTYEAGSRLLGDAGQTSDGPFNWWSEIYFDNDLGSIDVNKDGYKLLKEWLRDFGGTYPTKIGIITSNPVARYKMIAALKNARYILNIETQMWEPS